MRRLTWACYVDGHFVYSGDDPIRIKMCINHVRIKPTTIWKKPQKY